LSGLLSMLGWTGAGLGAQQGAASVASQNIANAATPGYSRRVARLGAGATEAGHGGGVHLESVVRARDRFLDAQLPEVLGRAARSRAEADSLESVGALDPEAAGGLADELGGFFASLRALVQNPGDEGVRSGAAFAAVGLAAAFQHVSQQLQDARRGLDAQVQAAAVETTQLAAQVAGLNRRIRVARGSGAEPHALLDARQSALDRLSELVGAVPVASDDDTVSVQLAGGGVLVAGDRAAALEAGPDAADGGRVALRLAGADGSPSAAVPAEAIGGAAGGWLDARDGALRRALGRVDALATRLASAVNAAHAAGFAADGSGGRDLFLVGSGGAATLRVNPDLVADPRLLATASAAGAGSGDASNVRALLAVETAALVDGRDAGAELASLVAGFGAAAARASSLSEQDGAARTQLANLREAVRGVSLEEETSLLLQAQRSFEAIGRVVATTDAMLQTLLKLGA